MCLTLHAAQANYILCHTSMRRSHPLPDQLPGEHTGPQTSYGADPPLQLPSVLPLTHTHSHMVTKDRSMVVGHFLMVHTCSFMCTNHIDMIAHTLAFLWVGEHFHHLDFHHASRGWMAFFSFFAKLNFFFFPNFLTETFSETFPMVRFELRTFHSASKHLDH